MIPAMKTVLITGANKGIGYGIVKGLLEQEKLLTVILTSRNESLGMKTYNALTEQFPLRKDNFYFHQLDITDNNSIVTIMDWIKLKFGQIDILVNNAGVATKGSHFDIDVYDFTFKTNVYGTIEFTEKMLAADMIRKDGKIIVVGSCSGFLNKIKNEDLRNEFKNCKHLKDLLNLAQRFRNAIVNNTVDEEGWPRAAYSVSKMIDNTYPKVLALRDEIKERNISVFACHPGWVKTDMAGDKAPLSIEEGAETELYLINLPDGIDSSIQGKYFDKCQVATFED